MNICLLEDSGSAFLIQDVLRNEGHTLYSTYDYRDIAEWITENPDYFDVLIFDLMLPTHSLSFIPGCKDYQVEGDKSPTLYFIKHFLFNRFPELEKITVFFSAYYDEFTQDIQKGELSHIPIIEKNSPHYVEELLKILAKTINGEKR